MPNILRPTRALLSIADKTNIGDLAWELLRLNVDLVATENTRHALESAGITAHNVAYITHQEESPDGSTKTLHGVLHAGLQLDRTSEARAWALKNDILLIDFLVAGPHPLPVLIKNLKKEHPNDDISSYYSLRFVDVGGPAALMSAAKNFWNVTVVSHHTSYPEVIEELKRYDGTTLALRNKLAKEAWQRVSDYTAWVGHVHDSPDMPLERPIPTHLHR